MCIFDFGLPRDKYTKMEQKEEACMFECFWKVWLTWTNQLIWFGPKRSDGCKRLYPFFCTHARNCTCLNILFFVTRRLARNVRLFDLQPIAPKSCHFVARSEHFEKSMRTVDADISLHMIILVYIYFWDCVCNTTPSLPFFLHYIWMNLESIKATGDDGRFLITQASWGRAKCCYKRFSQH